MSTKPVFISYSSADIIQANRLKHDLQNRSIPIWIDHENLTPGTPNWENAIEKAIPGCQAVIYLASPDSKASKYVRHELKLAEYHNILIIPFWMIGTNWLDVAPFGMATAQYIDARQSYTQALSKLLTLLQGEETTPPLAIPSPQPIYQTVPPKQTPPSPSQNQTQRTILTPLSLIVTLILITTGILYARTRITSTTNQSNNNQPSKNATTPTWHIITSPSTKPADSLLDSITALAPNNIWVVGYSGTPPYSNQPLIEHWNGSAWTITPNPKAGSGSLLYGITALTPDNIWAVGQGSNDQTLIEHWNGSAWTITPSPNTGLSSFLTSITALAPNNICVAGPTAIQPLIEHWNGSAWTIIPNPSNEPASTFLYGITALTPNNIWAVGTSGGIQTLIEHWNGSVRTIIPSPSTASVQNTLTGITALAPNNIWAVGTSGAGASDTPGQTLIEHWNGSAWAITPSPNTGPTGSSLTNITALAPNNIWAVGSLIEHWNGSTWTITPSPNAGPTGSFLTSITALAANNIWAVGYSGYSSSQALIEHYSSN